ncbi:hypothetical protein SAMN02990966_06407 [Rhodospirillales bacterium URHD0017]|nr:hypothetical protein SAMN02990966_06407 [Rhodospirillales bacterium URHD0017]
MRDRFRRCQCDWSAAKVCPYEECGASEPKATETRITKKSTIGQATDEVRTVAGKALGAAAAAATAVVVDSVAAAITQGGDTLKKEKPTLQRSAAKAVERPIAPRAKMKSAGAKKRITPRAKSGARSKTGRVKTAAKKKHR